MGVMRHYMLPALALLSACGEAIPDDQFANDGDAAPAGRQAGQTVPPAGIEKARCGPSALHRAQSDRAGA